MLNVHGQQHSFSTDERIFLRATVFGYGKCLTPMATFTKDVNPRVTKRPLKINGRLTNLELLSLVKEATGRT